MSITIPTSHRRILFQSKEENPVIKQARAKNYLAGGRQVFDVPVEGQEYNKTVFGNKGEEYGNE